MKITIDFIKKWTLDNVNGYICISKVYVKASSKLEFMCDNSHTFLMSWSHFMSGQRCQYCSGKHRYTITEVDKYVNSVDGYKLLSKEYKNCKQKLLIKCKNNHEFSMSFDEFKNGHHRCPICNTGGKYKYNLDIAKQIFKDKDCELLVNKYINTETPMYYKCSCGKHSKISLISFINGQRCYDCRNKKIGDILRTPYNEIVKMFNINECTLLSKEHEIQNGKTKVKYICSCGNLDEVTIDKFKAGERCNACKQDRVQKTFLKKYGVNYALANKDVRQKIRNTLYKNGTAPCSKQQEYIFNIIGGELNYPAKTLSLDIAFPEEMIYVEYDGGLHTGGVIFGTITEYDFNKRERNRTYGLLRSGWKEIRIISRKDNIPSDSKILEMIEYAKEYLNKNHHYIKFDIDNNKIINSQGEFNYDFGELRKIKSSNIQEANDASFLFAKI